SDYRQVVFGQRRRRDHAKARRDLLDRRRRQLSAVRKDAYRKSRGVYFGDSQSGPHRVWLARVDPLERGTVATEEVSDRVRPGGGVRANEDDLRRNRPGVVVEHRHRCAPAAQGCEGAGAAPANSNTDLSTQLFMFERSYVDS